MNILTIYLVSTAVKPLSHISRIALSCLALLVLSACNILDPKPDLKVDRPMTVVPQKFLYTNYEPLNEWLDTTIEVHLRNVPLSQVFRSPELRPMNYRLVGLQGMEPSIDIQSIGMSRRQLLWSIAHEHGLKMIPVRQREKGTSFIEISSRNGN